MKQYLIDYLYEALTTERGIVVASDDPLLLRTRLYVERRKDPILAQLSFVLSPFNPQGELWIVRTKVPDDTEI
jgi:hypothetical protein